MYKKNSKTFFILATFLMLPFSASAEPAISNVPDSIQHGQSVTVTGAGFGTKISNNAAPIRYDDFESGTTVGHALDVDLPYWTHKNNNGPEISNDYLRGSSTKNAKFILQNSPNTGEPNRNDSIQKGAVGFAATKKIYINYWVRWDWGTNDHVPTNYMQIKTVALYYDVFHMSGTDHLPGISLFNYSYLNYPEPGGYTMSFWSNYGGAAGSLALSRNSATHDVLNIPGWYNISLAVDQGTVGLSNGYRKTWLSDVDGLFNQVIGSAAQSNVELMDSDFPERAIDTMEWGWWRDALTTGTAIHYYDDIYIDNSWARIEIGDANTYDACTHREIQIPSAWNDGSITFTSNKGSFADGQAYLYVVDENGVQNATGFPITLTSTADATAPANPTGLGVI